jgi:16S rRNA G1207 methylase RsmC
LTIPHGLINRQVDYAFHGHRFQFHLSQSLFSSFEVDRGTRMLLETLYPSLGAETCRSVLDVGCGTGVLAIVLQRLLPSAAVKGVDRDALAVLFSEENARLNRLEGAVFAGALGTGSGRATKWDLVVGNLPAKAGEPVLRHLVRSFRESCCGMVGVVIVKPLADLVCHAAAACSAEIVEKKNGPQHAVFLYRGKKTERGALESGSWESTEVDLAPYIRNRGTYSCLDKSYHLSSVFHLSEFDTIGYWTRLAADLVVGMAPAGKAVIWSPGQGHLPVILRQQMNLDSLVLGGRDLLALEISRSNLIANGMQSRQIRLVHTAFPEGVPDTADLWVVVLQPELEACLCDILLTVLGRRLAEGGQLLIVGGSSGVYRVLRDRGAFRVAVDRKKRGYRGVVLIKKG